ncbi:MAG: heparinase II/III family protein, partial [Spirochaetia bacterium]|nr:heparinase II/III family protein [Spirochaetia bacterium]
MKKTKKLKQKPNPESWLGPEREELVRRIERFPELKPSRDRVLKLANEFLSQKPPDYEDTLEKVSQEFYVGTHLGNREHLKGKDPRFIVTAASYERAHKVFSAVLNFGFAYRITGEVRYAKAAIEWMVNSARWPLWTHPGWEMSPERRVAATGEGESFATAVLLQTMALGTELCFKEFVDHDLFEIQGAVVKNARRIIDDYRTGRPWYFAFKAVDSNQFTIPVASLGIAALAFEKWVPEAAEWLALAKDLTRQGLDAQSPDGAYSEGLAYANYGAKDYVLFAEFLASRGDNSLMNHPHLKNLPQWIVDMTFPDGKRHVNLNDSRQNYWLDSDGPLEVTKQAMVMYANQFLWYQRRYPGRGFRDYIMKVFGGLPASHWTLAWHNPEIKDEKPAQAFSGFRSYEKFGLHPWRGKIDGTETLLGLVAGAAQRGHKHPDLGSILFFAGKDYLLSDAGICAYSDPDGAAYFQQTLAHNTILVDGRGQIKGSGGSLLSQGGSGEWKWMVVEADTGYEALSTFRRTLVFSTEEKYFFVLDHGTFKNKAAHNISWHWHGEGSALAKGQGFEIPGKDLSIAGSWEGEYDGVRLSFGDGFVEAPEKPKVKYAILQKEFRENACWF